MSATPDGHLQQDSSLPAENGAGSNGHANGTDADPHAVLEVLRSVKACQQQRVQQYAAFNASFRCFLETKDEAPYRQAMVEATRVFGEVNEAVRSQERRLRQDLHEEAVAESLSALQTSEEAKLRFTLIQQALRQSANEGHFSWQSDPEGAASPEAASLASNPFSDSHQEAGHAHGCCGAVAEPTEAEFNSALAEATQELQAAVVCINDILMDLREVEEGLIDMH